MKNFMISSYSQGVLQTLSMLDSIVDNLLLLLSEKEKLVIVKRFGLKGNEKTTLEAIGRDLSVTRERVRQIENGALMKMRRNVFNTSLTSLHEFILTSVTSEGGLILEDLLMSKLRSFGVDAYSENSLHLVFKLHEALDCVGNTINFKPFVKRADLSDFALKRVSVNLINELQKAGDSRSLEEIEASLLNLLKDAKMNDASLRSLVKIDKRMILLQDNFLGLSEWRHLKPKTLRDKISYVLNLAKEPLHFSDIAKRIQKLSFDAKSVNLQAVHNELIRCGRFVLIGRGLYALTDWGYQKGTVAEVIEDILTMKNEMHQDEIITEVLKRRKVKDITIVLALKNSNKFVRVGRKVYALNK